MLIFLFIVVACLAFVVSLYNRLRSRSEAVKRGRSDLMGMMRKRATLVNQLVDICKGYGDHEKLTHLTISENASSIAESAVVARQANTVIDRVTAIAAQFPALKANRTYEKLMEQIHGVENDIQAKRESYNRLVESYNTTRASFPAVFFSDAFGFPEAPYFNTDEDGLETAIEFRTDDGVMLKATMQRLGDRAVNRGKALAHRAGAQIEQMRDRQPTSPVAAVEAEPPLQGHGAEGHS